MTCKNKKKKNFLRNIKLFLVDKTFQDLGQYNKRPYTFA